MSLIHSNILKCNNTIKYCLLTSFSSSSSSSSSSLTSLTSSFLSSSFLSSSFLSSSTLVAPVLLNGKSKLKTIAPIVNNIKQRDFSRSQVAMSSRGAIESVVNNNRVLSIQSHVVHGYVGNKSAIFPLQVLGFEVDAINSVQFCNHTKYNVTRGQVLSNNDLAVVFDGLKSNGLLNIYSHLLTGYVGNDSFLQEIGKIVKTLREVNPNLIYVCDPVLGDNGVMYVPENLIPIYCNEIIPLADICTPNQYEVELLTGKSIRSRADVWTAMDWFHNKGVKTVVVSSTDLGTNDTLISFLSSTNGNNERIKLSIEIPKQGQHINFTGTGDLFAALFLAHSTTSNSLQTALEKTIASLQSVIRNTLNAMSADIRNRKDISPQHIELKLIQSKLDLENPKVELFTTEE